jgi:predicted DNA-binding protein (MmcQ/YjbR family)
MHIEAFHEYCMQKAGAEECFPFGPETLVFKVGGKIFALTGLDGDGFRVNLKCEPARAVELRSSYPEVTPGYHMNKTHWNTVDFEGNMPEWLLRELIDHSYDLVVRSLPKAVSRGVR